MLPTGKPNKSVQQVNQKQVQPIQQHQQQIVVNNINISGGNNNIIVEYNKENNTFTFKNSDNNLIGTFSVMQLFKYLNSDIDIYLINIEVESSKDIIEKYLYDKKLDIDEKYELISYLESPFTSNIELLVKLYSSIINCEEELNDALIDKPIDIYNKIKTRNT